MRTKDIDIDFTRFKLEHNIDLGKVLVIILDGNQGKAKVCEAVEHGLTIIETVKGHAKRIRFEESELI